MSQRKRSRGVGSDSSKSAKQTRRQVTVATFNKWRSDFEREYQTLAWLRHDVDRQDRALVDVLWCEACRSQEAGIAGMKHFSRVWITGSTNHRTSSVVDHATSEQHRAAMTRIRTANARAASAPITSYAPIARMLLHLYYLYAKSPKKSRELADIVEDLKEVWEFSAGGDKPVRSQGSRWISHKRKALQRLVDRYGAYLNHVTALSEDQMIKSTDRARLKGYLKTWKQSKMLIGAAMYVDVLKAPSFLSLSLQKEKLDIVLGIQHILKSIKSLKAMAGQDPLLWPTVKLVCSRVKDEDGDKIYQGAILNNYNPTSLKACADQALADVSQLEKKMRARLEWSDVKMLRAIFVLLDTQSWRLPPTGDHSDKDDSQEEEDDLGEIKDAAEYVTSHFRKPLEVKGVTMASFQDEIEEIVPYARKYLSIGSEGYQKIWYKLYTAPDASKWPNMLSLCELLFSLPFSNAHVERMFSSMKVIKTNRRTNLDSSTLSDLLEIQAEGPPLASFSADQAVSLWWDDCKTGRRVNQAPRKHYRPRERESSQSTSMFTTESNCEDTCTITLDDWDEWFGPDLSTPVLVEPVPEFDTDSS